MKLSIGHIASWSLTSGFCAPKKSNVSRNDLNLFQPPCALISCFVNASAATACRVFSCAWRPSLEMMSAPNHLTHIGNTDVESILGSKPMRVRLPFESNLTSFFVVASSFFQLVVWASLIGTPAELKALRLTIRVIWFVNSGRPYCLPWYVMAFMAPARYWLLTGATQLDMSCSTPLAAYWATRGRGMRTRSGTL